MQINKDDHYCYCSDMLVNVEPAKVLDVIATGENHSTWASSKKHEDKPGEWVGESYFTGKEYIRLRFDVDEGRHYVDYFIGTPGDSTEQLKMMTWARVVDATYMGFEAGSSVVALYQPRFAHQEIDIFLRERFLHASEMYRIKDLAERGAKPSEIALPTGDYLSTSSELVPVSPVDLFKFISNGELYGHWTWGRTNRKMVAENTFQCTLDTSDTSFLLRLNTDVSRMTVDYYVGDGDTMSLHQSARVLDASNFGYEAGYSLVTFTRWRMAGQSNFTWDRDVLSQIIETKMTKEKLTNAKRP